MPDFIIVLVPYISSLNLSWIIQCLFLSNMEPLNLSWIKKKCGVFLGIESL